MTDADPTTPDTTAPTPTGGTEPPKVGVPPVATTPADASATRPAATILLLRDDPAGADGLQVLMLRRHARSGFAARAFVFPGGVVDADDAALPTHRWSGIDPEALAARFGLTAAETLAMHVAAVRETFEEAGVLLAHHPDGREPDIPPAELSALRRDLNDRDVDADFPGFLDRHDLVLDLSALTYWLRWVTPIQEPRRYDTCFFLAHVPADANPAHDAVETTETRWVSPAAAVAEGSDLEVIFPTYKTLGWMAQHATAQDLIDHAAGLDEIPPLQPHILVDDDGGYTGILMPDQDGYPHELYGQAGG